MVLNPIVYVASMKSHPLRHFPSPNPKPDSNTRANSNSILKPNSRPISPESDMEVESSVDMSLLILEEVEGGAGGRTGGKEEKNEEQEQKETLKTTIRYRIDCLELSIGRERKNMIWIRMIIEDNARTEQCDGQLFSSGFMFG